MEFTKEDENWMRLALAEAEKARELLEVPIGAVIVNQVVLQNGADKPRRPSPA